ELVKRWEPLWKKHAITNDFSWKGFFHLESAYLSTDPLIIQAASPGVEAFATPLWAFRQGEDLAKNFNGFLELGSVLSFQDRFFWVLQPRLAWRPSGEGGDWSLGFRRLEFLYRHPKVKISAGRGRTHWGPSPQGGLLLSQGAKEMDRLLVEGLFWQKEENFFLGGDLLVANLGQDYQKAWPWLLAYRLRYGWNLSKVAWRGALSHRVLLGGKGDPQIGFLQGMEEFFKPWWKEEKAHHAFSIETSIKLLNLRGLEFYGELAWEQSDLNFLMGLQSPRLGKMETMKLSAEYGQTSFSNSRSFLYQEGLSRQGQLLGYAWGPSSSFAHLIWAWDATSHAYLEVKLGLVHRRPLDLGESETRTYGLLTWQNQWHKSWSSQLSLGLERTVNQNFMASADHWNWGASMGIDYQY
ncbi:MAG: hypothetical protein KDK66_08340, partial [Deltaproteobacteria bacterium]|nr:hypothetical protein [Deltaproteobacteria bacterium]